MKLKILSHSLLACTFFFILSCDLTDSDDLGGSQSEMGETGNTFSTSSSLPGASNASATITELNNGVSTLTYSVSVTNNSYLSLIQSLSGPSVSGNTVTGEGKYRFTSEGIEAVYDDGTLTLVDYGAKVGDVYTCTHGNANIKREVTEVATEDDFFWGGMMIKTIEVEETGRGIPGVSKIVYRYNHKFGLVNAKAFFEDGTSAGTLVYSDSQN